MIYLNRMEPKERLWTYHWQKIMDGNHKIDLKKSILDTIQSYKKEKESNEKYYCCNRRSWICWFQLNYIITKKNKIIKLLV